MNANRGHAYEVRVCENLNGTCDKRVILTFVPAPVDLVGAEVPLGPHRQNQSQCSVGPATADHSLS